MDQRTETDVVAKGLFHIYRETEVETVALRGVDLSLRPGTWTSLMGPSGSGKSTLVYVLAGLLEPSGGSVHIDGRDITRLPEAERTAMRRRLIGLILQRDNLHPRLDAATNVALPLRLEGRPRREIRPRVDELLQQVGISDMRNRAPGQLSGGEAQRAAIAIALAARPRLLIADEPTGELDEATANKVLDLLEDARSEERTAILTVTHNPLVAERADHRFIMQDGTIRDA
ncbi:MAG: ABC transporter ATP-binding protein [Actinomycetota bacterium]